MRLRPLAAAVLLLSFASFTPATGAPSDPASTATRIHPAARLLFAHRRTTGHAIFPYRDDERFLSLGLLPLIVRLRPGSEPAAMDTLAKQGVTWTRPTPIASGAYFADATEAALDALEADDRVTRVSVDMPLHRVAPLDESAKETHVAALRKALRAKDGTLIDGKGVTILDVDGPIYQFHPAFFHADAGAFPWTDVDGDGKLTPNTDGVDLDGDGKISAAEVLRPLIAQGFGLDGTPLEPANGNAIRTDRDYLFLDANANAVRDFGASAGFTEDTPAYGEPVFIVDDANKNGSIDATERLLRLGTSKIAGIYSKTEYFRGDVTSPNVNFEVKKTPADLYDAEHATAVAGILVGGVSDHSLLAGLAPGADLLTANHYQNPSTTKSVQWGVDHGASVVITEYTSWISTTIDGSNEDDLLLDALNDKGIVTVSPAGNLGGSGKHRSASITSSPQSFAITGDQMMDRAQYALISVHHKAAGRSVALKLTVPGGTVLTLPESSNDTDLGGGFHAAGYTQTTKRGTIEHHAFVWSNNALGVGAYSVSVQGNAGAAFPAEVYLGDNVSGWRGGFSFSSGTDDHTICTPATSDKTITVGAYVLHDEAPFYPDGAVGALAGYSSRGPVFGQSGGGIEIAAPANPLSTTTDYFEGKGNGASFGAFGGTSGAGPHVAAAAALLRQLFPAEKGSEIRTRLLANTRKDGVSADETRWGKGKLDALAAAGVTAVKEGRAPTVSLQLPKAAGAGKAFEAKAAVEDDEDESAWKIRWDTDYDGVPDGEWKPFSATESITAKTEGARGVRVEVLDGQGNVSGATASIDVGPKGSVGDDDDDDDAKGSSKKSGSDDDGSSSDDSGCQLSSGARGRVNAFAAGFIALFGAWVARTRVRSKKGRTSY